MIAICPAYCTDEIEIPVWIVCGTDDRRVDVEHSYRLKVMLEAHGKRHSWLLLKGSATWRSEGRYNVDLNLGDHLCSARVDPAVLRSAIHGVNANRFERMRR